MATPETDLAQILEESLQVSKSRFTIDTWQLYRSGRAFQTLVDQTSRVLDALKIRFDVIGAMGRSGAPLASALHLTLSKERPIIDFVYITDPEVGLGLRLLNVPAYKPKIPINGRRVLLVDTALKTGLTALDATEKMMEAGATIGGVLTAVRYESFAKDSDSYQSLRAALKTSGEQEIDGRLIHLYECSVDGEIRYSPSLVK